MADSRCIVELKETIEKMNVALNQSHARIRELEEDMSGTQNEMSRVQEENARLASNLKECEEKCRSVQERLKLAEQKLAYFSQKQEVAEDKGLLKMKKNNITDSLSSCSDESDSDDEIFIPQNMIPDRSSSCSARSSCSDGSDSNDDMRNESHDAALNINSMPEEILIKIFGYLSHNQLGEIARVCTKWNVLTRNPVLWEKVDVIFSWIRGSQNFVAECFVNRLPPCVTCLILNFWNKNDWIDLLNFEELAMRLRKRCPLLKMLRLENAKLSVNLPSIIDLSTQFLRKLKKLAVHSSTFPHCPAEWEDGMGWDDNSKIKVLDLYGCYITHYNKPPFAKMPNLKKLFLACTDVDDSWFEEETFYLNQLHELDLRDTDISSRTFQIMQTHAVNLRKLYLCDTGVDLDEEDDLNFPHLKTICLRFNGVTCENIVSLIKACPFLQNVYVEGHAFDFYEEHPFVNDNECKLGIVKDDCCSYIKSNKFYE